MTRLNKLIRVLVIKKIFICSAIRIRTISHFIIFMINWKQIPRTRSLVFAHLFNVIYILCVLSFWDEEFNSFMLLMSVVSDLSTSPYHSLVSILLLKKLIFHHFYMAEVHLAQVTIFQISKNTYVWFKSNRTQSDSELKASNYCELAKRIYFKS